MATLEEISEKCIAVCQVPIEIPEISVYNHVKTHFQYGQILDADKVDGIESNRKLTRLVLLCSSVKDVDHVCNEVKEEGIEIEGVHFVVKYQKAIACELPDRWENFKIPDQGNNQPSSSTSSEHGPQQSHAGPEPPPRKPQQPRHTRKDQQVPPNAWPPGPYGPMSGLYHNIPQGGVDNMHGGDQNMNKGGMPPHMPMYGQVQGRPPMHGNEHQQGQPPGFPEHGHGPGHGQPHGPQQNIQYGPGGHGQFPPGYPMFRMPQNFQPDQHNAPGAQNMPFAPGMRMPMPMFIDPQTGQMMPFPGQHFANMPHQQAQGGGEPRGPHPQQPQGPPPPYNSGEFRGQGHSTEVNSPTEGPDSGLRPQHGAMHEEPANRTEEPEMPGTEEKQTKIVVSNLPSTVQEEYLEMFFENTRKSGGGPVAHVDFDEDNATALVEFEEPEAVDIVLNKCPIKMMGQEVEVAVYKPEPPVPLCTIEVTGPCSIVCQEQLETLEMYFESERRSGGGEISDSKLDSEMNMVLITFENEEVAKRVEERASHVLKKEKLTVKLHVPTKQSKKSVKVEEDKEVEPEKSKTIKVKGVDKSASRDTVEFYFENQRRSGGGEIEEIKSDEEDEDVIYITFKDRQAAAKVASRGNHQVEGKQLKVSLYVPPVPPPSYDNKILIKGLKPTTTQDCLFNFIEAKTGFIPDTMDYHAEQEDVVMVTFTDNLDFQKLEKVFGKSKLEGASLKVYPVPISNCIIVANLVSEVTKDTVEFYFENTRKSGGGQVEKVVMNDDDTCLVYFADFTVIDGVLERSHKLGGQTLDVKRYQECLGRPEGEIAERTLRIPEDVVLKDVDSQKIKFMKHSNANRSALETQLGQCNASITWPEDSGHVILICTLTKEVKDCFKLVKQWKETAEQNFKDFMKNIIVSKVPVLQDIWSKVMEELQSVTIENPEAVAIFVDKIESIITVVGNKLVAEGLSKKIDDITKKVMAEVEKEREKIKEVFTALKLIETRMLLADKFPTEMEKLFPDLKVKINQNKNEIVFEGPLGQVRDAKLKMYEMKSRFATSSIDKVSNLAAGLFLLKQTKEHVVKKLKASRLTAVWDITDGCLVVYSTSDEQIQECVNIIRGSVIENTIALKKASKTVVNSENWQTKVDELHAYNPGKCVIKVPEDASKVQVCATDDIAKDILENVQKFLRLNTVTEVKVPCTKNAHRLIERHYKNELQNIAKSLQHSHVQIVSIHGYGGFEVHGTEDGIQEARAKMSALLKRVQQREHTLSKPGLAKHMQTPKGKDNLNTIESTLECVVSVKDGDDAEDSFDSTYDTVPVDSGVIGNIGIKGLKIIGYCKAYDCRNIYTAEGDMTELTVDMIVNSADDKLSLTGGLGKAIVQKGGKEIQKECNDYIRTEGRLDDGDAYVSTAGNLKADFIVHVRGPVWRGGRNKEDEMLSEAVFKCLQQASARNLTSVAMPAISCGTYGYPVRKATSTIVEAVKNFFREVQESTVTDIYLCDMKLNTVDTFNEALKNAFGETNFQKFVTKQNNGRPHPAARKPRNVSSDDEDYEEPIRPMDTDEEEDDYYSRRKPPPLPKGRPSQRIESGASVGNISVSVVKGEIAKQKVDVMVNTTAKNLDLKNGAVSASLLKSAGAELQQEVSGKYPSGIKDGEIAVTSGQKLKCDIVIHSSMMNWDGSKDEICKKALHKLVKDCMNEAEKQNKSSIAFPAIGTGNLGFPRDVVASEMLTAVSKFAESNPASNVKDVRFIVYQKDLQTIQAFEAEVERWSSGKRGGGRQTRKFDVYEDLLQGRGKDDDSDTETQFDKAEHMMQQKIIRKEKMREANYVSPLQGLQRIRDPKYWLEDDDIDKASSIIKNTNSDISGLEDVCVTTVGQATKCTGEFIQILHSHKHHWVTATTVGCDPGVIKIYDSMYRHFDKFCVKQIIRMSSVDESSEITVELAQFQKQKNKADCGLFAIAAAFSLTGRRDPSRDRYDFEQMRNHLYACLSQKALVPFPEFSGTVTSQRRKIYRVAVCCQCTDLLDLTADQTWSQCDVCRNFCHAPKETDFNTCSMTFDDKKLCRKCYNRLGV